jgi:hypothetical protein
LTGQNYELNREFDRFLEADAAVRSALDRKNRVMELREKNDVEMRMSMTCLGGYQTKSPVRRSQKSPFK